MCPFFPVISPVCFSFVCRCSCDRFFFFSTSHLFSHLPDIFRSGFWNFGQNAPPDGPIQGLAERLKTTILSSKANSTSLLYHRAYRKWKQFAISTFDGNVFPANPIHVALYLQHLIEQSHSPNVIDSAFYGMKWAHSLAGIPSPTDNPIVEAVRSTSKRILGTAIVNRKDPISSSVIHDIISRSNLKNPVELRNVTLYVLSFAGFFRFDDVSRIRRNDIFFNEGLVIKSKNDQLRRGFEVVISELPSPACPVKLLRKYLTKLQIPPDSRDLIFRPISKGKDSCKLIAPDKPISYSTIRQAFRRDLKTTGVDPSKFGLHSLRSGGAPMAANSGVSRRKPKKYMSTTIWVKDSLFPNSLDSKPCKLLVSFYHAFAQFFVTLYRGGSRQAHTKLIWFSDAVLLFVVE